MSQPAFNLPQTPLAVATEQKPLMTAHAPYAPPAIRAWVQSQEPQPQKLQISAERNARRCDVRLDKANYPNMRNFLHPHFCLNAEDRRLAFHEGVGDIRDAVS